MLSHFQGPIHFYKTSDAKKSCSDAKKRVLIFSKKKNYCIISSAEGVFIAITTWANQHVQHVLEQWFSLISPIGDRYFLSQPPWIEVAYYWKPANIYLFRFVKFAEITSAPT